MTLWPSLTVPLFMSFHLKFSLKSKLCLFLVWALNKAPRHWTFIHFWKLRNCICRLLTEIDKLRIWFYLHNFDIVCATDIWWNSTIYGNEIIIQGYCLFREHGKRRQDESLLCFWFTTITLCGETIQWGIHLCKNMPLVRSILSLMSHFHRKLILGNMVTCSFLSDSDFLSLFSSINK